MISKNKEQHKGLPHHEGRALHTSYEVPAGVHVAGHNFGGKNHREELGKKNHEQGYHNTRHERMQHTNSLNKSDKTP